MWCSGALLRPLLNSHLVLPPPSQELRVFLEAEGELAEHPMWCSLRPLSQGGLIGGTAKLSKQLFGLERSVLDPVQVRGRMFCFSVVQCSLKVVSNPKPGTEHASAFDVAGANSSLTSP